MTYIPDPLRRFIKDQAGDCCEYCLIHQEDVFQIHEIDHALAEKHGGQTIEENLCLSCAECNRHKGSDIASIDFDTGEVALFFNPRRDKWSEHFQLEEDGVIKPLTPQARVTVRLLQMNSEKRILERKALMKLGRYPR